MKRGKKAQITLFVIIAIILVGAIVSIVLFRSGAIKAPVSSEDAQKIVASEVQPVKNFVADCIKTPYENSLKKIGLQGGYCVPYVKYNQLGNYSVPYLVSKSGTKYTNNILLLEGNGPTVSKQIDMCVDMSAITKCINNFKSFKDVDVKSEGELTWTTSFSGNNIVLNINYPLTISRGDAKTAVDTMTLKLKSGLFNAYSTAVDITNSEIKSHDFNIDVYVRTNLYITIDRQGTADAIYYYLTTVPEESETPYNFHFAVER